MRECDCNLQFLLAQVQSFSGLRPMGLMPIFYCLNFDTPKPGGPGSCIYFSQEKGGPVIPRALLSLFVSYNSQGYAGGILTCLYKKICGEAYTEWNYNTMGSHNCWHKSNQHTKSLTPM
jgi:hypothetical protein